METGTIMILMSSVKPVKNKEMAILKKLEGSSAVTLALTCSQTEGQGERPHHSRNSHSVLPFPHSQVQHRSNHRQVALNAHTGQQQGTANQVEHVEDLSCVMHHICGVCIVPASVQNW